MKKKLSLFLVALFALVAYAASTTWKVTADGATSIEAGTTLTDNDVLLAKTVYASNVVGGCTIGNEVFDNGFQVRVAAFPSGDDKTGTEQSGSTPVVITAKKDCDLTVYYRRQSTAQTENKGAYADNDGKDLIVYKQSDLSKLSGTLTIDHETDDGKYGWATKKVSLTAGETYTLCAKGTTIQFFGFTYETEDPQPAETKTIYMRPGVWASDAQASTRYAVYAFNVSTEGNQWFDMTEVKDDEGTFTADIPESWENIILVRMDGTKPENNWNNKWNQTADIGFSNLADKTLFTISSTDWGQDTTPYDVSTYTGPVVKYHVSVAEDIQGGSIGVEPEECAEGTAVTVYVKEGENFKLDELFYIGETSQSKVDIVDQTFNMPKENVVVHATFKEIPQPTGESIFVKVTEFNTTDSYIIVDETKKYVMGTDFKGTEVTITDGTIPYSESLSTVKFAESTAEGYYTIKFTADNGQYLGWNSGNNLKGYDAYTADNCDWSVSFTDAILSITSKKDESRKLQSNKATGDSNNKFAPYTSKQNDIAIYKLTTSDEPQPQPADIKTLAINGEFPGMSWDPEEGIAMQPEATAAGLWTLELKNVTVEGKQYDYKAFADGKTDGYQLPAQGNNNWVFGTDEYPAGTYDLLFTANTSTNELTLAPTYVGPNTIAQLNALANKKEFTFTGNAIVVAHEVKEATNTNDHYIYIKDETGASLIYDKGGAYTNSEEYALKVGNVITAPWTGRVSIYNGLFEVVPTGEEQLKATSTVEVKYPEATADDVKAENVNQVVEIKGLSIKAVNEKNITFAIGNDDITGYNQFGIELPADYEGKTFDVVGAVGRYIDKNGNDNIQFQPFTITEVEPQLNTYTATFTTNLGWKPVYAYAYNYTPADEAEGVQEHIYVPVEWPGTLMTLNAETGVYEVAIESAEEPNLIIFNDGTKEGSQVGINQTPNWEFENEKAYDYSTQPFAVSFTTDKDWKQVFAYTWSGDNVTAAKVEQLGKWPGREITESLKEGVYTYEFEAIEAPDSIIFNNGTEAEVKEQTGDLPFVNGTTYTFSEEKATAWAGDPDVAISKETGIIIPAETLVKADVQAEKIIHIVAKEITAASGAKSFNNDVAEFQASDILILKNDGTNEELVPASAIEAVDDGYQFKADFAIVEEVTKNGLIVKPANDKKIGIELVEVEKAKAPAPVSDIVYDFAAAAAAGENPENLNGGTANGAVFYGWENEGKTYSKRQDYKGYTNYTGTNLPTECHVWRRSDRINNYVADGGLKCPNQREMAINGLAAGKKVVIEYTGEGKMLYATGYDPANATAEPNTVAIVGDGNKAAISGTTEIASGDPIHIVSTDAGYFVFRVLRGMVITKITISEEATPIDPATVVKPNKVTVATGIENGTVKVSQAQAYAGDEVTVTTTPAEGYKLDAITVTGVNTNEAVTVTDGKFTMIADDVTVSATFVELAKTVYDFAAAAAAGENPSNVNGGSGNGAIFYGWESAEKTYSKRQDYKGYAWAEGSVLPEECHVWRRSDRINGNIADGGLKCPSQKEMAINGLTAGQKVVIEYAGEGQMLYATGYDPANATAEPNTVAIVGDGNKAAISGTTAIPSGTPIHIVSTDNGYFVFRVLKNMVITKITISEEATPIDPATVVKPNKVTLGTSEGGTVKVSQAQAFEGDKVYATFTPNDGYKDSGIVPTIKNDADEDVTASITFGEDENGSYLVMPAFNITVSVVFQPQPKFYIIGGPKEWKLDDMTEMTFNATTQAYEFEYAPTTTAYFAFADKQFTAEEAAAEGAWNVFNSTNRYSLGRASDTDPNVEVSPSDEAKALVKGVEGTIALKAGTYKISVAKDFSTVTITGEVYEPIYTVAGAFVVGEDNQASFFGTAWDPTAAANDMEKQEDGTYKKVYENVSFTEIGQIQFKIVEDHSWAVNYGWDGYNAFFDVTAPATNVTVTFTFDPNGATDQDKVKIDVKSASTAINGIDAEDADGNTPIYNLSGQKVTKSYKGVVIKNGKKYMQK